MPERCSAIYGDKQCRRTKNLTRTRITIVRTKHFIAKLPKEAVVLLCPECLKISPLEKMVMTENRVTRA